MPPPLPSVIDRIADAMSVSSARHQVIASNIANRDTPGYQRLKLQFDGAMSRAGADSSSAAGSIEQDLVALSSNGLWYQSLARSLNRYFSILNAITSQGRG